MSYKNWEKYHNSKYPTHKVISRALKKVIPTDEKDDDKSKPKTQKFEPCQVTCYSCKSKFPLKDKSSITHCNQCQGELCPNCTKTHTKGNPTHKTTTLKTFIKDEPNGKLFSPCTLCGDSIDNNSPMFNCTQCKRHKNINFCKKMRRFF